VKRYSLGMRSLVPRHLPQDGGADTDGGLLEVCTNWMAYASAAEEEPVVTNASSRYRPA
jgi:hypothetical protein